MNWKRVKIITTLILILFVFTGCGLLKGIFGGDDDDDNKDDQPKETQITINLSSPTNSVADQPTTLTLTWEGDATSYEIYLDKNNPPTTKINSSAISQKTYEAKDLEYGTTYYWKVVGTKDGTKKESEIWNFKITTLAQEYVPIKEEEVEEQKFDETTGDVVLEIKEESTKEKIKENSVIVVDLDTSGVLRKVVSVKKDGQTITLKTEQARMEDLFKNVSFKLSTDMIEPKASSVQLRSMNSAQLRQALTDDDGFLHPVKVVYHMKNGENISKNILYIKGEGIFGKNLYKKVDLAYTLFENSYSSLKHTGHLEFDPTFKFEFDFGLTELRKFSFYSDESKFEFLSNTTFTSEASYKLEKTKKLIDNMISVSFKYGSPPIWITVEADLYAKYLFEAAASLTATTGFKSSHYITLGSEYHGNEWQLIKGYKKSNEYYPLTVTGNASLSSRFEIYPQFNFMLYSIFGPNLQIIPYLQGDYKMVSQAGYDFGSLTVGGAWDTEADIGLDASAGVGIDLDIKILKFKKQHNFDNVNFFEFNLWKSPDSLQLVSGNNQTAEVGKKLTTPIKFKVLSNTGVAIALAPIFLSGDGTTPKSIILTGTDGTAQTEWTLGSSAGEQTLTAKIRDGSFNVVQSSDVSATAFAPTATSISPTTATIGLLTSFTITGANLTSDLVFASEDLDGEEFVSVSADKTTFVFKGTPTGTAGSKNLVLKKADGTTEIANFAVAFVAAVTVPNTPTNLAATLASSTQIDLTWTSVSDATKYYIYRATTSGGTYTKLASEPTDSGYTDNGLSANTTYYYKVKAVNSAGESGFTAVVSATTQSSGTTPSNISMVSVAGGTFQMGSTSGDSDEKPVHSVTLISYKISKYEITNAQFIEFLNAKGVSSNGSFNDPEYGNKEYIDMDDPYCAIGHNGTSFYFKGSSVATTDNTPAIEVTWYGANAFCKWAGGRLPTEAEWEFAARGGTSSNGYTYSGSNTLDDVAWYGGNSGGKTHPVGTKSPNELGIYDMSGNVWEWCSDWYGSYSSSSQNNPQGPSSGSYRVFRGGSWSGYSSGCRVATRNGNNPSRSYVNLGFRLVVQ